MALTTAVFAVVLAIASLGGNNAMKDPAHPAVRKMRLAGRRDGGKIAPVLLVKEGLVHDG